VTEIANCVVGAVIGGTVLAVPLLILRIVDRGNFCRPGHCKRHQGDLKALAGGQNKEEKETDHGQMMLHYLPL